MKDGIIEFLKIYLVFILFAVWINLFLEISLRFIFEIPETLDVKGIMIFFSIFNFFGALIFFFRKYKAKIMGLLSLVLGQVCEFSFMRPEWVQKIYALEIGMDVIMPFIISSIIYWFPAWLIPSYVIHRYLKKMIL